MENVWVSLLAPFLGSIPTLVAVILSNRSHDKVVDERLKNTNELINERTKNTDNRIEALRRDVEKHNDLVERVALVEASAKSAHKRLDDMSSQLKITSRQKANG